MEKIEYEIKSNSPLLEALSKIERKNNGCFSSFSGAFSKWKELILEGVAQGDIKIDKAMFANGFGESYEDDVKIAGKAGANASIDRYLYNHFGLSGVKAMHHYAKTYKEIWDIIHDSNKFDDFKAYLKRDKSSDFKAYLDKRDKSAEGVREAKKNGSKLDTSGIQYFGTKNQFNYDKQQLRIDHDAKTYEKGMFTHIARRETVSTPELRRIIQRLDDMGYKEVKHGDAKAPEGYFEAWKSHSKAKYFEAWERHSAEKALDKSRSEGYDVRGKKEDVMDNGNKVVEESKSKSEEAQASKEPLRPFYEFLYDYLNQDMGFVFDDRPDAFEDALKYYGLSGDALQDKMDNADEGEIREFILNHYVDTAPEGYEGNLENLKSAIDADEDPDSYAQGLSLLDKAFGNRKDEASESEDGDGQCICESEGGQRFVIRDKVEYAREYADAIEATRKKSQGWQDKVMGMYLKYARPTPLTPDQVLEY